MNVNEQVMKPIARILTDFPSKFGVPRQSGLADSTVGTVVFEPEYRRDEALRGIEEYSHLWLIWVFSDSIRETWSPTVRPPRLGGNRRVGVFASRSPYRPNPIGLSSVRLLGIETDPRFGRVIRVGGADLTDGTPILDIKPYLAYTDSHPDAKGGFSDAVREYRLEVDFPAHLMEAVEPSKREGLLDILSGDPRPSYQHDPERIYGMEYAGCEVRFTVSAGQLTVCSVTPKG